jgi:hypothetical protein
MKNLLTAFFLSGAFLQPGIPCGTTCFAEPWRSELYGEDWRPPDLQRDFYTDKLIQDYSYAGYRLGERIPEIQPDAPGVSVFNVTEAPYHADPTGASDSTPAIQQAIDDAGKSGAGRSIVYLPEGTYRVAATFGSAILRIDRPNIILRGAGIDKTFLLSTTYGRDQHIIAVRGSGNYRADSRGGVAIRHDLMGPARVIPVERTAPFSLGDWIVVRADITSEWVEEHQEPAWLDFAGTGELSGLVYYRQVVAVDHVARALVIDIPTRYALKTRDFARVNPAPSLLPEVGLEDFSIGNIEHPGLEIDQWASESYTNPDHHAYEVHGATAIFFRNTRDSWVKNVHSFRPSENLLDTHLLSNGVHINSSRSLTLENVHMQRPLYGGGGGNGYMFRLTNSSDVLLTQCQASYSRHGFVFSHMSTAGSVIHDSIDRYTNRQAAGNGISSGGRNSDHHMLFSHSNLVDHSRVRDSMFEARYRDCCEPKHAITAAHSTMWNTMGLGPGENAVHSDQGRYGYVIGTRGLDGSTRFGVVLGDGSRPQTAPQDHVEGVGEGATLFPSSLYEHQLERRRSSIYLEIVEAQDAVLPVNTGNLRMHATVGKSLGFHESDLAYQWSLLDGPGPVTFTHPDQPATGVLMEKPGTYRVKLTAAAGEHHSDIETTIRFSSPAQAETTTIKLLPTDDAHVQKSDPGANFGSHLQLQAKVLDNTNERQIFLRFDLSEENISAGQLISATFHLQKTAESTPHTGALYRGGNTNWSEASLTYLNKPAADDLVATWQASGETGPLELEMSPAIRMALEADSLLTLRLAILAQSEVQPVMRYASKEHSESTFRPHLVVTYWPQLTYDQWAEDEGIPLEQRASTHDRYGRGVPNLVSFLTGVSPAAPQHPTVRQYMEGNSMRFSIPWRPGLAHDPYFLIYESQNLIDWVLAGNVEWSQSSLSDGRLLFEGKLSMDQETANRRFYRIRFFLNEVD